MYNPMSQIKEKYMKKKNKKEKKKKQGNVVVIAIQVLNLSWKVWP